ncbi:arrestin domain protein [Ancylostoma caninum]|uniref:Arrestin domain protein n=1 Tax=Ancylostoma caninum TaxID=29170 RepID=A0A368G2J0_ANCCA|nr:arrestin domain protein [Ancylostoma caninum]
MRNVLILLLGGEVITGQIRIELRSPIVINAVKLQLKGRATWLNDPVKKDNIEKVYFDQDFILLERPPGKAEAGHFIWIGGFPYSLPFECPLPKGCPTSYEGPYAFIRYFIKASLIHEESDGKTKEYYVKKAFSIVSPSEEHVVRGESVTVKDSVNYGKCCCKGKLMAELSLPKTGYLPGEMVMGSIKLGNKYPKDILKHMEVRIVDRVVRVGAPEKAATSPYRTLYYRKIEMPEPTKGSGKFQKDDIHLLTIPSVCPTTKGDFDLSKELHTLSPNAVVESPSTATLRQRKQPFIRIEYAIQLSLGNIVLLEAPITIGELSTYDSNNVLKPFVAGPQPIEEVDETQRIAIGGPFMYTPVYSMKSNSSNEAKAASDGSAPARQARTKTEANVTEQRKEQPNHNTPDKDESTDVAAANVDVSRLETSEETTTHEVVEESTNDLSKYSK